MDNEIVLNIFSGSNTQKYCQQLTRQSAGVHKPGPPQPECSKKELWF